jgi:hypothetical protein
MHRATHCRSVDGKKMEGCIKEKGYRIWIVDIDRNIKA